jgi:hypothetical protein
LDGPIRFVGLPGENGGGQIQQVKFDFGDVQGSGDEPAAELRAAHAISDAAFGRRDGRITRAGSLAFTACHGYDGISNGILFQLNGANPVLA